MTDAAHTTYEANEPKDWTGGSPAKVDKALDELAGRSQGGLYDAYDATGGQTINGTAATANLDTTRTNSDAALFVLAADELTLTLVGGGTVDISYRSALGNTGIDPWGFDVWLEQAPAATGTFAEVAGSRLKMNSGGPGMAVTTLTSSDTLTASNEVVFVDASSGAVTVTLPAVVTGTRYYIKKIDSSANAVTIDGNASETVEDSTTKILSSQYDSVTLVSDGTEWFVV